ncbi:hypothetical protein L202_00528 [Cryptococcus amylolentus CBS 6039]|uniref:Uncharacterized protein n=1 Tax=Cryptococcus amylolentus CBS 6039 TaxID=1295533 RepID=A0A1E3I7M5_9TREE|nr:hypothetical protein L202_00528 [Cryptococcus amylolentus CBS 6039]ODN84620.1 hypothetical protein L202_00528 [Cryptococcus amylolentus CBS 6039]
MNEDGFQIGVGGNEHVYTTDPKKAAYVATTTNHQSLTTIEAISAASTIIPPQVILPGKKIMSACTENDLPNLISCFEHDICTGASSHLRAYLSPVQQKCAQLLMIAEESRTWEEMKGNKHCHMS